MIAALNEHSKRLYRLNDVYATSWYCEEEVLIVVVWYGVW